MQSERSRKINFEVFNHQKQKLLLMIHRKIYCHILQFIYDIVIETIVMMTYKRWKLLISYSFKAQNMLDQPRIYFG